jgi:4-hydroxy-4-methyl-2-oxoglutarate aldolase
MTHMSTGGHLRGGLNGLLRFDACTIANAIERFNVRPRNEGFMGGSAICRFPHCPPVVGHAVTGRIRTYMPPVTGKCYYDNVEWWRHVLTIPPPRVVVLEDFDHRPGFGALFGEVHARICRALECVAFVTNGAVRDLQEIETLGFQLFAGNVSVSHAYAHIVDFGEPIEIGGLEIKPGDILHGDRHGILSVPSAIVEELPRVAEQIQSEEKELFKLIASPRFSVEVLGATLRQFAEEQLCK